MSDVFIVGGGYVGGLTASLLRNDGLKVTLGRRTPGPGEISLDVLRPESFPDSLKEAQRVVYTVSADNFTEGAYQAAYVTGVQNVLNSLKHPERIIFISSTGVYAQDDGSVVDEGSETLPRNFSGVKLLEGENLLKGHPGCALRFSGIYGPGRARLISEVSGRIPRSRFESYTNRIHQEDCARAIVHLLALKEIKPVYIGSDEEPAKLGEILEFLATEMGIPGPQVVEGEDGSRNRGGNKRCSSALLRSEGFSFKYPTYREGFRAILRG
jgi:nucleoside-diphosphate-sugar epimerase